MSLPVETMRRNMLMSAHNLTEIARLIQGSADPTTVTTRMAMEDAARLILQAEATLARMAPRLMAMERDMAAVLVGMHDLQRKIVELR